MKGSPLIDDDEVATPVVEAPKPNLRRRLMLAGAGVAAAAIGAGVAWKLREPPAPDEPAMPEAFWKLGWDSPKGDHIKLESFRGQPLLINFWATWCAPCIEELPLINAFYQQHSAHGWQVLGLAVDRPAAVTAFLKKMPLDFPVGLAGLSGSELAKSLGNVSEALPFSVVIGRSGQIVQRKLGRLKSEDLQAWAGLK